jgi:hypothetical protein
MRKDAITTLAARAICARIASGTTDKPEVYSVLWMGEKLALVHRAGNSYWSGGGGQDYCSPYVDRILISSPKAYGREVRDCVPTGAICKPVHDCGQDKDGRLTKLKLAELVHTAAHIEAHWDERLQDEKAKRLQAIDAAAAELKAKNEGPGTYMITWQTEVDSGDDGEQAIVDAAHKALAIQRDPDSTATHFRIMKKGGSQMRTYDFHDGGLKPND